MPAAYTPLKINKLIALIEGRFDLGRLERAVQVGLGQPLQHYTVDRNLLDIISALCLKVNAEGAAAVADLLRGLKTTHPDVELHAALDAIFATTPAAVPAGADPFEALLVTEVPPLPIVNRQSLRSNLRSVADPGCGYRALSVDGPAASGKTYSKRLIQHIARAEGAHPITIEVVNEMRALSLQATMEKIAFGFSPDAVGEVRKLLIDGPTDAQAAERFVGWVGNVSQVFAQDGQQFWLVLDGLNRSGATPVRDLLVPSLLQAIADDNVFGLRLFLLGDDGTRVGDARHIVLHESTQAISGTEIGVFLTAYAALKGWTIAPTDLTRLVERVVGGADWPFDHKSLEGIRRRLELIVPRLRDPAGPLQAVLQPQS